MKIGMGVGGRTVDEVVGQAERAKADGFQSTWIANIFGLDAIMAAAIAGRAVPGINIGTAVTPTFPRHPHALAQQAMTAWDATGGRFTLGIGAGWNEVEFRAFGLPFDHRVSRFEEAFTIVRGLLRDGAVSFSGAFHSADDCVLLPRSASPPPFMLGSMGPRMLAAALPFVDMHHAWFAWFGNRVESVRALEVEVDAACDRAGRDPSTLERSVALYVQAAGGSGRNTPDPNSHDVAPIPLAALSEVLPAIEACGIAHVQLVLDPITVDSIAVAAEAVASAGR